jgi:hypothetical protein
MFIEFLILDHSVQGNSPGSIIDAHKNARLSDDFVSDLLNSDHLLYVFHPLHHINLGIFRALEKFTDFESFQIIAYDLIP